MRRLTRLAIVLGLTETLLLVGQAAVLAAVVQRAVIVGAPRPTLLPLLMSLLPLVVLRAVLVGWRTRVSFRASARVRSRVRLALLAHLAQLGPMYVRGQQGGALATSALDRVEALDGYFAHYLPQQVLAGLIPFVLVVTILPFSWVAAVILLVTGPLIPVFMVLVGKSAEAASQSQFQALARFGGHFLDQLQGLVTLKLFNRAATAAEAIEVTTDAYRRTTIKVLRIAFLSSTVLEFFASVSIALVAVYLGLSLLGRLDFGHYSTPLTLGTALFILLLTPEFYQPLRLLGNHYHDRAQALGAAEAIQSLLALPLPERAGSVQVLPSPDRIGLQFENVSLAYEGRAAPALDAVSFAIEPGQRIAVVGPSGAGKSSLFNLLLGFAAPSAGRIVVNGLDLAELDQETWLRHLAWLGQNPMLFHGSIRDNIRVGRIGASAEEIERVARQAQVWAFARELPAGLDTPVGERGLRLSGGQAQRVALARALLRDAPLLLLDEVTASLDGSSEQAILETLDDLSGRRTLLMLSHRLTGLDRADRILVLSRGRIVEQGSQAELLALDGYYRRLYRQFRGLE